METLTAAHLLAFNAALLLAVAGPGPAFLVCVQASLTGGRRDGVLTGAGLAVTAGLWTLAALMGLEALFDLFPLAYTSLKIAGAVLVLYFAVRIWREATTPIAKAPPTSRRRAFLRGVILNLANPKSILFSAGVLLVIFPPGLSLSEMALITANHVLLEMAFYAILAILLSRADVQSRYLRLKPIFDRTSAVVLGGLGLRLLLTP